MAAESKVYRLTQEAYDVLDMAAKGEPALWLDPNCDFGAILEKAGVTDYLEETGITTIEPIRLSPVESTQRRSADIQALNFYRNFRGMWPRRANDERLWAWINHFQIHDYALWRWPKRKRVDPYEHIRRHWFTLKGGKTPVWQSWQSNAAGRTWWIAHTAVKASEGSDGAFTADEALELFARAASIYHALLRYNFARHKMVLGEIVRAFLWDMQGMNVQDGAYAFLSSLNLIGGTQVLEMLERKDLREIIQDKADIVMSDPKLVTDSSKIRNRKVFRSLSLGAGVQSTALALMADKGLHGLPKPDMAIFADTGWEPQSVYEHLDWLETQLSFPVVRVQAGNIKEQILAGTNAGNGRNYLGIPAHLVGTDGSKGVARRQCTANYKVAPIRNKLRQILGAEPGKQVPKGKHVEIWIGISVDEAARAKPSRDPSWSTHRFPLIELEFSRAQLYQWFHENFPGRYLPRSACIGCPYKGDAEWKWLKDNSPSEFEEAAFVDRALREIPVVRNAITSNGASAFLHRSRLPLAEVTFDAVQDYDDHMSEECEGLCGI